MCCLVLLLLTAVVFLFCIRPPSQTTGGACDHAELRACSFVAVASSQCPLSFFAGMVGLHTYILRQRCVHVFVTFVLSIFVCCAVEQQFCREDGAGRKGGEF